MREFFNKYKGIILPLILVFIFFLSTALTWGKWGHIIYDCFREAVLPQAILDGKVLYRDITNLYPPLGYYFNALLYLIFGNSLNTLYWAGIINSFLILSIIYVLIKKYSSDLTAFIAVLSIIEIFVFRVLCTNSTSSWIFPYSYSFIYAFSTCLLSFYFYILYKEKSNPFYLYLSFLSIGASIAFKFDFILCALIPLYDLIKYIIKERTKSLKLCLISLGCLIAPFIISILIYFAGGGAIIDLRNEIKFLADFSKAPSVLAFNQGVMPQSFKPWVISKVFKTFKYSIVISLTLFLYIYFSVFAVLRLKNIFMKFLSGSILFIFGYFCLIKFIAFIQLLTFEIIYDLAFVSYIVTISVFIILIVKVIKNKGFRGINFSREEKFYFLTVIFAGLLSFRSFALLYLANIGNFMIAIWWMCLIFLFLELLPKYFPSTLSKRKIKISLNLFFIAYALYFTSLYITDASLMTPYKIQGINNGVFYNSEKFVPVINKTAEFINENISKDESFLVSEEGLVLNYLTGRKTDLKYYALIPHMIDAYGEDNIINDLAKNPPDYFFVTNNVCITEKLGGVFGLHYAKRIAIFIMQNYDYIKTIKNPEIKEGLEITVFKLKE